MKDLGGKIEILKARLEEFDKRARLEEEQAADFRSLTADLFIDALRQYERINRTSQPRASSPLDYSTIRLIDLVPNLDQQSFLAATQPSSDEYYWLEEFSEVTLTMFMLRMCFVTSFYRLFDTETDAPFRPKSVWPGG